MATPCTLGYRDEHTSRQTTLPAAMTYSLQSYLLQSNQAIMNFANFPTLSLALSMALVGANVGIGKTMIALIPVTAFALMRYVIAVIALSPRYRLSAMRRVTAKQWWHLLVQAFFGTFLFTLLMLYGVSHTTATAAGVITATLPACVALLSWLLLREVPSHRTLLAIVLAIAGVVLLNFAKGTPGGAHHATGNSDNAWLGNALVLGAVVCEAVYVVVSKHLSAQLPAIDVCAYTHLLGFGLMLPVGLSAALATDFGALSGGHWALLLWYGLAASVFSFFLWMRGIRHVPAQLAGVFTTMVPISAATYGVLFLNEQLSAMQGAALGLAIAGIVLASMPSKRGRPASSTSA